MDSNTYTKVSANITGTFIPPALLPQIALEIEEDSSSDIRFKALLGEVTEGSGRSVAEAVNELATCGHPNTVRTLLKLFATGGWELIWVTQKALNQNFNQERATISATRMVKEFAAEFPLLKLVLDPIFVKNWEELQVEELVTLCTRIGQLSNNADARDRALYDGLYYVSLPFVGKQNASKFSASMNKRECELQQLQFLYDLAEKDSLCRSEAISFLLESVGPGTSLLPKNRAKVGLKNVALKSGVAFLQNELLNEQSDLRKKQHAAQLLGRLKNTKCIPVLLEAFSKGSPELRSTIKEVLDRYFPDVYQWYQQSIIV